MSYLFLLGDGRGRLFTHDIHTFRFRQSMCCLGVPPLNQRRVQTANGYRRLLHLIAVKWGHEAGY